MSWSDPSPANVMQWIKNRRPEEIFAAEDLDDWNDWINFFSRTRKADDRHKGLVEIVL